MVRRPPKSKQVHKVKNAYRRYKQRKDLNKILSSFLGITKMLYVNAPVKPQTSKFIPRNRRRFENKLIRYKCTRMSFKVKCKLFNHKCYG